MKAFFSKSFSSFIKNNYSLPVNRFSLFPQFNFSTFRIEINDGNIKSFSDNNVNVGLNWQLAKVWINPSKNCHLNSVIPSLTNIEESSQTNEQSASEECRISGDVKPVEFERFIRKYGLIISREENVYVEDGLYKSKKVRLITSDIEDARNFSKIFEERLEKNDSPDVYYMLMSNNSQIGESKRFVYFSKAKKIVLSNSKKPENITKGIELI